MTIKHSAHRMCEENTFHTTSYSLFAHDSDVINLDVLEQISAGQTYAAENRMATLSLSREQALELASQLRMAAVKIA